MKIVLVGAGSAQFGAVTLGDLFQSDILAGSEIVLVDIDCEALDKMLHAAQDYLAKTARPYSVSATTDRTEAFKGADAVVISIEVGSRFPLWDMDWSLPQQYGIHQVYGENGGAGGTFHALRIVPVIVGICDDIVRYCPQALVLNYSNPMSAICTTVERKYPDLKFIGLCHEIASLERYLPGMLGTSFDNLSLRAAGLNHFSVLLEATYKDSGRNAYPDILAKADSFFEKEPGYSALLDYYRKNGKSVETEGSHERVAGLDSGKPWADRTLFEVILHRYHLLPITTDSHLGEYISWAADVADHKGIKDFYNYYRLVLGNKKVKIDSSIHERLAYILEGYAENSGYEEPAVNIRNDGFIPDLPSWLSVEVPARITEKGAEGIAFPDYPKGFLGLLRNYSSSYDLIAEAVLHGSKEYALQALMANPVIDVCAQLPELLDQVIAMQSPWLDYLK
ncbi:MAG: alpha-glucosidase [Spirochaetia bacterium]|jgi:alpha-galactosidase|nr:alpha-glucosidase [Spirochaetia bacterium]